MVHGCQASKGAALTSLTSPHGHTSACPPSLTSYTAESEPSTMANTMIRIQPMVTRKPSPHVFTSRGL